MIKKLLVLTSLILVSACTSLPPEQSQSDPELAWQARQRQLSGVDHFSITGRMSITRDVEAWHISVSWKQTGNGYAIELSGPFGAGQVRLSGNGKGPVLLETSEGKFYATSPEQLLFEQTGVYMPVNGLRYWLLGLPEPSLPIDARSLDAHGRLQAFTQEHWKIAMKRYTQVNGTDLPDKVFAEKDGLKVRLVIDEWFLGLG